MLIDLILIDGKFGNRIREDCIKKYHYDYWVLINKFSKDFNFEGLRWTQRVFNYMYDIKILPKCLCGKELGFRGRINCIYNKYCSTKCSSKQNAKDRMRVLKQNNMNRWGVENVFQLDSVKKKSIETNLKKYGFDNPNKNNKIREKIEITNNKKYGQKSPLTIPENREKMKNKCKENWKNNEWVLWFKNIMIINNGGLGFSSENVRLKYQNFCKEKWGVLNSFQSEEIKERIKNLYIDKYGVSNPQQVESIHIKTAKSAIRCKKYKNSDIYYQGSYELDFLNKYSNKFKVERGYPIKYDFNGKIKVYFPDFYLPEIDLIVEIKSSYFWRKNIEVNLSKINFIKENNINFILILDKDYQNFDEKIKIIQNI